MQATSGARRALYGHFPSSEDLAGCRQRGLFLVRVLDKGLGSGSLAPCIVFGLAWRRKKALRVIPSASSRRASTCSTHPDHMIGLTDGSNDCGVVKLLAIGSSYHRRSLGRDRCGLIHAFIERPRRGIPS